MATGSNGAQRSRVEAVESLVLVVESCWLELFQTRLWKFYLASFFDGFLLLIAPQRMPLSLSLSYLYLSLIPVGINPKR